MDSDRLLHTKEIAGRLGVSVATARRLCAEGAIAAVNIGDGQRSRYAATPEAIEEFIANRTVQPKQRPKLKLVKPASRFVRF